ncbi:hypothetical protein V5O48_016293 [Marasmius crinis-equi]|uniref:Uncharacterized protein n=1 Tax=Marasmius crinis-equi TaxID=585013 RepID=A0ABR3ESE8_9AGAR
MTTYSGYPCEEEVRIKLMKEFLACFDAPVDGLTTITCQPSFLETLKRSNESSSSVSLDEAHECNRLLSEKFSQASTTTATAPALAFTLDLSPIIEDLHVFENVGLGPGLPSLKSLATVGIDSTDDERICSSLDNIDGFCVQTAQEGRDVIEVENGEFTVQVSDLAEGETILEEPRAESTPPPLQFSLPSKASTRDPPRKPSLVLQRASVVVEDDQNLSHLPALTLTRPTPELSSQPVFENANPHLPSLPELEISAQQYNCEHTGLSLTLRPVAAVADQSVSSLSLPMALARHSLPHSYLNLGTPSSMSRQHLRPPSPGAASLASTPSGPELRPPPFPMPTLPRCTACGFGFGAGFDMANSTDMLNVSRIPCEMCEEQWHRCVQWYLGDGGGDGSGVDPGEGLKAKEKQDKKTNARFSWLPTRIKKDGISSTSTRKRLSLGLLPGIGKRASFKMPTVTTRTVTTVERRGSQYDKDPVAADEFGRRKSCRTTTVTAPGPQTKRKWKKRLSTLLHPAKPLLKRISMSPKTPAQQTAVKRYSTVGVQAGGDGCNVERTTRPISTECSAPQHARVSGDSRFREEISMGEDYEEAFQDAMEALPPLRHRYL